MCIRDRYTRGLVGSAAFRHHMNQLPNIEEQMQAVNDFFCQQAAESEHLKYKDVYKRQVQITTASADASFRRYFRLTWPDGSTRILMDAPPDKEDCKPFIHVASLLAKACLLYTSRCV